LSLWCAADRERGEKEKEEKAARLTCGRKGGKKLRWRDLLAPSMLIEGGRGKGKTLRCSLRGKERVRPRDALFFDLILMWGEGGREKLPAL